MWVRLGQQLRSRVCLRSLLIFVRSRWLVVPSRTSGWKCSFRYLDIHVKIYQRCIASCGESTLYMQCRTVDSLYEQNATDVTIDESRTPPRNDSRGPIGRGVNCGEPRHVDQSTISCVPKKISTLLAVNP
uniref:Secreted protein n=1 Tax=Timema poppense TaxID=170557 RepID=A0A7R9DRB4_TIMPO|nr:unnamed protein product [Timema poppensis]